MHTLAPRFIRIAPIKSLLTGAALLLLALHTAQGLQVAGYTDAVNNRFTNWNSDLVPNANPAFALAGLDVTGLFWDSTGRTYAALSNQSFIGGHVELGMGSTISYWDGTSVGTATIASSVLLTDPASAVADAPLYVYTLTSALSGVTALPILTGGSVSDYEGMQIAMFGQAGQVVLETLDLLGEVTYDPTLSLNGPHDSIQNAPGSDVVGAAQENPGLYQGGDSNSAVLGFWNGQWGVLGTAWAITDPPSPQFSLFNFMPAYVDEIPNGVNYSVLAVPEPERAMLLAMGAVLVVCRRRRKRHTEQ
ncbi:putative secreted protein with PEP-CTERM sorting signal [Roseimicrobium gellanilyticum]|uniref:Putative secreted protein with PEP-CTERM sorting signal n=1 Tax=Roseimicrobium gellanilyticum TaxID=748857 RepID=A0A366HSB4_9BACT|nr:hypothetical protein [Roseimicrobium gellanilyticum]RBP45783.1 putative secreted protein with PEP-CTERM sorting signal [Roseimicrobium gellanilyticum]